MFDHRGSFQTWRSRVDLCRAFGSWTDLGCGWLHSADRNPWVTIAQEQNRSIDKTPPPWRRGSLRLGFPEGGQQEFLEAQVQFSARVSERATREPDVAASTLLEPGNRWNNLINAVGTYDQRH